MSAAPCRWIAGFVIVVATACGLIFAPASSAQSTPAQDSAFDEAERVALERLVHDYLMENPEVIMQALTILQQREDQAEQVQQRQQLAGRSDELFRSPDSPIMGNPNGDVTVVEFFDYQCGYCKRVLDSVFQLSSADPNLRVVFKELPILGPASVIAARAALAAREQDRYVDLHNALMSHRGALDEATIFGIAGRIGLDVERLRRDMDSPAVAREIQANMELAQALGIRGTPAFVIGDRIVPGAVSLEVLRQLVAEQRPG